eukprot:3477452-Alexandrium_andersonii.AAC.1
MEQSLLNSTRPTPQNAIWIIALTEGLKPRARPSGNGGARLARACIGGEESHDGRRAACLLYTSPSPRD